MLFVTKQTKPSKPFDRGGKHANRQLPCGDTVVEPLYVNIVLQVLKVL